MKSSGPTLKSRILLAYLLIAVSTIVASLPLAYPQHMQCQIVHMDNQYPDSVVAGQSVEVATTLTVACDMYTPYTIKVDLIDVKTGTVSAATYPYSQDSASFVSPPIVNQLNAPTQPGNWALEIHATVINEFSGQAVASTAQAFSIKTLPNVPTTTTTTATQALTTTTSVSTTSTTENTTSSFSQTTTTTSSSQEALTTQTTATTSTGNAGQLDTSTYVVAAVVAVALIVIVMVGIRRRGQRAAKKPKQQTSETAFCWNCGKKLLENAQFCGHCGTKQADKKN